MIKLEVGNIHESCFQRVNKIILCKSSDPKLYKMSWTPQYTQEKLHLNPHLLILRLHFYLIFEPGPPLLRKASRLTLRVPSGYITT